MKLPLGGIGVCGRTGSGKSTCFFGSELVRRVIIADTGSQGHRLYHKGKPDEIMSIDYTRQQSPIEQAADFIAAGKSEPSILDSFTTLQEQQVAWFKRVNKLIEVSLPKHKIIVGQLIDFALFLANSPVFVLFNTSPGGMGKNPDGTTIYYPKGSIVGYPALAGLAPGRESILSRFTTCWVVTPGARLQDRRIPRGFILPGNDTRPEEAQQYCPIKDPMALLVETEDSGVDAFPPVGTCAIDVILKRLTDRQAAATSPPAAIGVPSKAKA